MRLNQQMVIPNCGLFFWLVSDAKAKTSDLLCFSDNEGEKRAEILTFDS